jgi:uncharacterized protein YwgA
LSIEKDEYSFEEVGLAAYNKMDRYLLGSDLILMLLSISSIKGKTRVQKQVFLTWKELFYDATLDPAFFPWRYGAFSKVVEDLVKILEGQKYITIKRMRGEGSIFIITHSGRKKISEKMKELHLDYRHLPEKKIDWDEWSHKGILRYVYGKYPEYTTITEVPHLKW